MSVFAELKELTIVVKVAIAAHLVHHEVFFVFQLTEHHREQREKLRQTIDMHIVGKVAIKNLVIWSMQIVALEHIYYFEHEHAAGFCINALLFHLIARDIG